MPVPLDEAAQSMLQWAGVSLSLCKKSVLCLEKKSKEDGGEQVSAEQDNRAFEWWERASFSMLLCLYVRAYGHVHSC